MNFFINYGGGQLIKPLAACSHTCPICSQPQKSSGTHTYEDNQKEKNILAIHN